MELSRDIPGITLGKENLPETAEKMGKLQIGRIIGGGNLEGKLAADGFHSAQIGTNLTCPDTYIEHRDLRRLGLFLLEQWVA